MNAKLMNLFAGTALVLSLGAGGCVVRGQAHVGVVEPAPVAVVEVDEEPPPAQVEVEINQPRAGFVWITGRWVRAGGRWEWSRGHWERERSGQVWEVGRWERRGNKHVYIEGHWRAGGPVIRDHREERHEEGPVIRDHRSH